MYMYIYMYYPIRVSPKGFPVEHIMIIMDWRLWSSQISSFPAHSKSQFAAQSCRIGMTGNGWQRHHGSHGTARH